MFDKGAHLPLSSRLPQDLRNKPQDSKALPKRSKKCSATMWGLNDWNRVWGALQGLQGSNIGITCGFSMTCTIVNVSPIKHAGPCVSKPHDFEDTNSAKYVRKQGMEAYYSVAILLLYCYYILTISMLYSCTILGFREACLLALSLSQPYRPALGGSWVVVRWTPKPVIVATRDDEDYIMVPLYTYCTTITGWRFLLR